MNPTPQQLAAIQSDAKNILCCAGPGSGKSFVIIERIKRLVRDGYDPKGIVALSYTNSACKVLVERLGEIELGCCSTLHGYCLRYLQNFEEFRNVTILDAEEADIELVRCASAAGWKGSETELRKCRENWETECLLPKTATRIAVASYYRQMQANRMLDFNAVLTVALERMTTYETPRLAPAHLFVDERQDASELDLRIYAAIGAQNNFWVGDPMQCIFGFRSGATPESFAHQMEDPTWEVLRLEGNFRSAPEICEVANKLAQHAQDRILSFTIKSMRALIL